MNHQNSVADPVWGAQRPETLLIFRTSETPPPPTLSEGLDLPLNVYYLGRPKYLLSSYVRGSTFEVVLNQPHCILDFCLWSQALHKNKRVNNVKWELMSKILLLTYMNIFFSSDCHYKFTAHSWHSQDVLMIIIFHFCCFRNLKSFLWPTRAMLQKLHTMFPARKGKKLLNVHNSWRSRSPMQMQGFAVKKMSR